MACTAKELQSFLIERGAVVGGRRKLELAELCEIDREINLQVDSSGLIEGAFEFQTDEGREQLV